MAGRPPKPTALKLLQGNPGRRKLNDREPKPQMGAEPPDYIKANPALLVEWGREAPRQARLGTLTESDGDILGRICVLRLKWKEMLGEASGSALAAVSKELRSLELQFGMGAANRVRVKVEQPKPETKLARFTSGA